MWSDSRCSFRLGVRASRIQYCIRYRVVSELVQLPRRAAEASKAVSSFLYGLARSAYRRRALVLLVWLAATVLIGGFAGVAGGKFQENFSLPGTESQLSLIHI